MITAISKITMFEVLLADQVEWEACHLFVGRSICALETIKGSHSALSCVHYDANNIIAVSS